MNKRKIFKLKAFVRWMKANSITDAVLLNAAAEVDKGLIDAELGGGLLKKRIAFGGRGKRSGARTIIAFKTNKNTFFLYGFMKNEKENIDKAEMKVLKKFADYLFSLDKKQLNILIEKREVIEVVKNE